jgi:hypothetical protein
MVPELLIHPARILARVRSWMVPAVGGLLLRRLFGRHVQSTMEAIGI